jgi:putative ABC transport system permease protein
VTARLYWRILRREWRGARGRLLFFVACLAVGVAAVVAVAGISATLDRTIRGEARQLLAADLAAEGRRPLPAELDRALAAVPGARRVDVQELVTVVAAPGAGAAPGRSQLVELKVVDTGYPFYGRLDLLPPRPLDELLGERGAVVAPALAARLGLRLGDPLRLGGADFVVTGMVRAEPDRIGGAFTMGPRVFVAPAGLARTSLAGRGSRVLYRALIKLPAGTSPAGVRRVQERLERALAGRGHYEVQSYTEAQPSLRRGVARAERFLGLVALLSLLIGGVGVAQTVRAWIAGRLDAIAILKCLGVRPREAVLLYVGQTALLGAAGTLVGLAAGTVLQWTVPSLLGDLLPVAVERSWQPLALLRGLGLGMGVALLFSLPPLTTVARVPPARVLRRDAEPLPPARWLQAAIAAVLLAGLWGIAAFQARSPRLGVIFVAATLGAALALAGAALLLGKLAGRLPRRRLRVALRHGLTALARPGAGTAGAAVALGLGVLVVLALWQVETQLAGQLARELPADAPSAFLVDVQPAQWDGVRALLAAEGADRIDSVPVVMARLVAVDGRDTAALAAGAGEDERDRRWALTREQRLTYMATLPPDNELVAGSLWNDPRRAEVSVEEEFARELGVRLGSVLRFDVQGVPLELAVTSLRSVEWETFAINFFLVVEPGVLDAAPQVRLAAARLPRGREQRVQDLLAARYPNVTLLQVRDILERIRTIFQRIGRGVQGLGGFTVAAGIAILAGAVSAGAVRRAREVALLKTLGMTRAGVAAVFATEYALVGLVAATIGVAAGAALAWAVLEREMEIAWQPQPVGYALALVGTVLLAVAAGLAASLNALRRRPAEVLRGE